MVIMSSNSSEDGGTTTKCFSAILNRLLCAGNLPNHPSDHLPQLKSTQSTHQCKVVLPNIDSVKPINQAAPSFTTPAPAIVARLMGLDPFPNFTSSSSLPKTRTLDSILRSRSVNYVNYYRPHLDFTKQVQAQAQAQAEAHDLARHRLPTFLLPQNHDLLVLCLDQGDEITKKHELGMKELMRGRNNSLNKREKEEKHKKSCKRNEDEPKHNKVANTRPSPKPKVGNSLDQKRKEDEPKRKPNKEAGMRPSPKPKVGNCLDQKRNVHAKPIANLKVPDTLTKPTINRKEVLVPATATATATATARKRNNRENSAPPEVHPIKVSSSRSNKYDHQPCPNYTSRSKEEDQDQMRQLNSKTQKPLTTTKESDYLVDTLKEICRLAEEDMKMGSVWVARSDLYYEDFEEICYEVERETLETLLSQVVDEVCQQYVN